MNYTDFAEQAQKFWDTAHTIKAEAMVADHPADKFIELFGAAGPFVLDLAKAKSVLDIGPGYAQLLRQAPTSRRFAVEISTVNRERLKKEWDIEPLEPGEVPEPLEGSIDLAWSSSCFNHCSPEMMTVLISQLSVLLKPAFSADWLNFFTCSAMRSAVKAATETRARWRVSNPGRNHSAP